VTTLGDLPTDQPIPGQSPPTGSIAAYAGASAPTDWLLCDGSAVNRTTYAALFAAISITYGSGDGSSTFNVPDLRGRVPVGEDGAAGRITSHVDTLGQPVPGGAEQGRERVQLTEAQMPSHYHQFFTIWGNPGGGYAWGGAGGAHLQNPWTNTVGSDAFHTNMQPYQVVHYIIKT
jgi:microcystin-dependent protein